MARAGAEQNTAILLLLVSSAIVYLRVLEELRKNLLSHCLKSMVIHSATGGDFRFQR